MDFSRLLRKVPRTAVFRQPDYHVWCGTMVRTRDGVCHFYFSRWPKETGKHGWLTHSEIGYAVSDNPLGPYEFVKVVLPGAGGDRWDAHSVHNPTVIEADGKFLIYYMGTRGNGERWNHRNNQRIGVAVATDPAGPFERFDKPLIDVTRGSWDHLMVSNPSVARDPSGKFIMVYKGVADGPLPRGGAVVCGVAEATDPVGPFTKVAGPIMINPENDWSVEDPFIWYQDSSFWALVKDFHGYFTGIGDMSTALFRSEDGLSWSPAETPLAFKREIHWEDGEIQKVGRLERPQLWLDNGKPSVLFCAVSEDEDMQVCYNVHIPLETR